MKGERVAESIEGAVTDERPAVLSESAEKPKQVATPCESAEQEERPKYRLGYPRIESSSHHLWEAQQANWPDHLPHEAWRAMVEGHAKAQPYTVDSADHPAFGQAYVTNYAATPEAPSQEYVLNRQGKQRR